MRPPGKGSEPYEKRDAEGNDDVIRTKNGYFKSKLKRDLEIRKVA